LSTTFQGIKPIILAPAVKSGYRMLKMEWIAHYLKVFAHVLLIPFGNFFRFAVTVVLCAA
jgi:hypothetical protein